MSKKEILEFIAEIEEIANTHQDSQCLLYDTEEECAACEDSVTENGKTCALKGMFEIINKCKEFREDIENPLTLQQKDDIKRLTNSIFKQSLN